MGKRNKGLKVRLYPNKEQEAHFKQEVGNQRWIWNKLLWYNIRYYNRRKEFIFYNDMHWEIQDLKMEYEFLTLGYSQSLQQTARFLDKALKACFKSGFGFPKFKKKGDKDSYRIPQNFFIKGNKIQVPKVGKVKFKGGKIKKSYKIKNITILCENGKWYASLCIEFKPKKLKKTKKKIGIDVGSIRLYTRSDGKKRKAFRKLNNVKVLVAKIKEVQQQMSWKQECWKSKTGRKKLKKGEIISNSWLRLKVILGKLHEKLKRIRTDHLHKITTNLVKKFDLIIVEDLKLKNMTKSSKGTIEKPGKMVPQKSGLNRNLLSNGLGMFFSMLEYKCDWYGKIFKKVDPKFTSQICSSCGKKDKKSRKSQSRFKCTSCGFLINADHNAALNILARAA
jgi:IS605 OrfB family transposase